MRNDLGGEEPPYFPIEISDFETSAAAGLPHTDTGGEQASGGGQIDMDTPMDDDFGGEEIGSSTSPAPVPPQEDAVETTSEMSRTQQQSSPVQPEEDISTTTRATTTLSAILPKMRFRKIRRSSAVADAAENVTHRPQPSAPDPGSDMELSTGSTDGEDDEAEGAWTSSSSAPLATSSTSSNPARWTLPDAHDAAAAASSHWARSYSDAAPSTASSFAGPRWSHSRAFETAAFGTSATSFNANRSSESLSDHSSFFSTAGSAVDRSSAPEATGAASSFSATNAPPPLHSLRQYQPRTPTTASAFHPARAYGNTPATVEARTEVEILHEDLAPGEVTNVVGGGGKKNCSILRVVQHPRDNSETLELPVLKELLKESLGDVYDDL